MDPAAQERLVGEAQAPAAIAAARGDAPFGAVLADASGAVLLRAANGQVTATDPTAHAEIVLIRAAARELGLDGLEGLAVATNAEPCSMCLSALVKSRVATILYGAPHEPHIDPAIAADEIVRRSRHRVELIGGILAERCAVQIAAARVGGATPD